MLKIGIISFRNLPLGRYFLSNFYKRNLKGESFMGEQKTGSWDTSGRFWRGFAIGRNGNGLNETI